MNEPQRPIVFLSVFKSGTAILSTILEELTGLRCIEPPIVPGRVNYQDPDQLIIVDGTIYSWHLFPVQEVKRRMIEMRCRPVLLMRNVYDVAVSMYYHFANNVDAEVGRGRNVDHYFREMSREDGLTCIIQGMTRADFRWRGAGPHYHQMALMLELAEEYPSHVTSYERLTSHKKEELQRLVRFLELDVDEARLAAIVHDTGFEVMRAKALRENQSPSHYREGRQGSHVVQLNDHHVELVQQAVASHAPNLPALLARANLPEILALGK